MAKLSFLSISWSLRGSEGSGSEILSHVQEMRYNVAKLISRYNLDFGPDESIESKQDIT